MKIIFLQICVLFGVLSCDTTEKQEEIIVDNNETEVHYMDGQRINAVDINNNISLIQQSTLNTVDGVFASDSSSINKSIENALFEFEINSSKLKEFKDFPNVEDFGGSIINLIDFYQSEFNGGYLEMLPFIYKKDKNEKDLDVLKEYEEMFAKKENDLFKSILEAQELFAQSNNIKLEN